MKLKNKSHTNTILVVVAHTDDESLGAGGTIAKHAENGDSVYGIAMTNGVGSRSGVDESAVKTRRQASINAAKKLGLTWLAGGDFDDNSMDSTTLLEIIKTIEKAKALVNPTIIYTHSAADLNIDHRIVSQATLTAFRPQPNEVWREIRAFETPSATEYGHKSVTNLFYPNLYVDIEKTWGNKIAALNEYKSEIREAPHARSIEGIENLAKYRGSQVGLYYAEAFEIIRKIER